jgi:hypothetical protein
MVSGHAATASSDGVTFTSVGTHTWTPPSGVTSATFIVDGAQGVGTYGGLGAEVVATLSLVPGEPLKLTVAGSGALGGRQAGAGGFGGGGAGSAGGFGESPTAVLEVVELLASTSAVPR